jgi:multidrug efflux pump subunit AcrA (membrane-fusion protein)
MKIINKKTITIFIVVLLLIIAYFLFFTRDEEAAEVKTMKAYNGDIEKTLEISGSVKSSDSEEISIQPNLKVLKIYVKENDYVSSGDLLAELEMDDLQTSLEKANLSLQQLNNDLNDMSSNSQESLLINGLEKSKTNVENLESDLENAEKDLETSKTLYENDAISEKEYESQIELVENLESSLKTALISYEDAQLNLANFNSNEEKAKKQLELQIESIKLDIESLERSISERKIYSNIDGIVTDFNLKEGRETNNSSVINILNSSNYEFISLVPQEDAVLIEEGQDVEIKIDGLENVYYGKVAKIGKNAEVDQSSGSQTPKIEVEILINSTDNKIASGYKGDAVISIENLKNVLLIRNEAIKIDSEGSYVFIKSENTAKKTYINTGISDGYITVVQSGISRDEEVVLNPPEELNDGNIITVIQ